MPDVGIQIDVVEGHGDAAIAEPGSPAGATVRGAEPAKVNISVWDGKDDEFSVTLQEGEVFEIAGQSWRLDKTIHDDGRGWYADLTRIA